jgi:hypothetical protein
MLTSSQSHFKVRDSWYNRLIYKKYANYIFTTADYTTRHLKNVFNLNDRQVFSMPSGNSWKK